jgi:hypothetical protein
MISQRVFDSEIMIFVGFEFDENNIFVYKNILEQNNLMIDMKNQFPIH